jgi:hypothetical protein
MPRKMEPRPIFSVTNPNRGWVVRELDRLRNEWAGWLDTARGLGDSPDYNPETCAESIKDGWDNIRKHEVLREKTLVFIGNQFAGYEFLFDDWPSHPHEDNLSRLRVIIPTWIHRLETLSSCIEYARLPDGFWTTKGKQLVDKIIQVGPEKGAAIATSWLKNPLVD